MASYKQVIKDDESNKPVSIKDLIKNPGNQGTTTPGNTGAGAGAAIKDKPIKTGVGAVTGFKPVEKAPVSTMSASNGAAQNTSATKNAGGYQYADYQESDTVKQAEAMLNEQLAQKPGEYQSAWQTQLNDAINKILNREKFSYDLNGDALYQQYKDKYSQQGKMAMMDTMGQAQAMTGGYGNSYAQSVGQQAYQSHLQELNDIVPELYQMAYDQYNQEGQDMYTQAALMAQQEDRDYGRYQDAMNAWQAERDYLAGRYDAERDYDYGSYIDDRNYQYQKDRDAIDDERWQLEFEEAKRQYDEQMGITREQWSWEKEQAALGDGGNGGDAGDDFHKAIFSRVDDNGNYVFYIDGKERIYAPGVNPYTGTKNSDTKYGAFSNGYQPNNIKGQKLSKTGITDVVNGVTQNVWKTPDGKLWIWDGTQNKYLEYDDGSKEPKYDGSGGGGGGKTVQDMM
jgi:hypothetical protein